MSLLQGQVRPSFRLALLAGLISAVLVAVLVLFASAWVRSLNDGFESLRWRLMSGINAPQVAPEQRVVLVDVDNASLAELGTWPWPRDLTAKLLERLAAYQPSVVGMDMAFPDRTQVEQDQALIQSMAKLNASGIPVVVGQIFDSRLDPAIRVGKAGVSADYQAWCAAAQAVQSPGYLGFFGAAGSDMMRFGHLGASLANSGWVRAVPAVVCNQQQGIAALGINMLAALSAEQPHLVSNTNPSWWGSAGRVVFERQGLELPLSQDGQLLVPYSKPRNAFISVSARDLLTAKPGELPIPKGAVVVVGSTAFGLVDSVATPLADNVGGFEVHAQLLVGALDGKVPVALAQTTGAQLLLVAMALALGLAGAYAGQRVPVTGRAKVVCAWLGLPVGIALGLAAPYAWLSSGFDQPVWPWAAPILFAVVFVLGNALLEAMRLGKAFSQAYSVLGTFFASVQDADNAQLAFRRGESQSRMTEMTLLAVRLRNFSRLVNRVGATQSSSVLQQYYEAVTEICHQHQGVVLEFLGDTVLCGFPLENENNSGELPAQPQVIDAANSILEAAWLADTSDLPELCVIAAVEQGDCLIGMLGHRKRRASVVVGEAVSAVLGLLDLCTENSEALCIGSNFAAAQGLASARVVDGVFAYPSSGAVAVPLVQTKYRYLGQFMLQGSTRPHGVWAAQAPAAWLSRNAQFLDLDSSDLPSDSSIL